MLYVAALELVASPIWAGEPSSLASLLIEKAGMLEQKKAVASK